MDRVAIVDNEGKFNAAIALSSPRRVVARCANNRTKGLALERLIRSRPAMLAYCFDVRGQLIDSLASRASSANVCSTALNRATTPFLLIPPTGTGRKGIPPLGRARGRIAQRQGHNSLLYEISDAAS